MALWSWATLSPCSLLREVGDVVQDTDLHQPGPVVPVFDSVGVELHGAIEIRGTFGGTSIVKYATLSERLSLLSLFLSRVAKIVGLPFPLVLALMALRSAMFRRSVRWAYTNRGLATRSGRVARRQRIEIEGHYV